MSKDNFISAVFGVLLGFIAGYLMHEVMAGRQPPRLPPGMGTTAMAGPQGMGAPAGQQQAPFAGGGGEAAGGDPAGTPGGPPNGAPMMAEVRDLEDRLAKDPKDPVALRRLGDLNFDISNWQKAEDLYSRYLEVRPDDPDVMTDLGVTLRGLKEFDRALEIFQRVEKVAPDHWQSLYNQVVVLAFDLNRLDQAQPVLDELKRLQPNNDKVTELADAVQKRRPA